MFCVTAMVTQGVLSLEQSKLPQGRGALPPAVGRGKTSGLCFLLIFILTFLFYPRLVCGVLCQTLPWVRAGLSPWGAAPGLGPAEGIGTVTPSCAQLWMGTAPGGAGQGFPEIQFL